MCRGGAGGGGLSSPPATLFVLCSLSQITPNIIELWRLKQKGFWSIRRGKAQNGMSLVLSALQPPKQQLWKRAEEEEEEQLTLVLTWTGVRWC